MIERKTGQIWSVFLLSSRNGIKKLTNWDKLMVDMRWIVWYIDQVAVNDLKKQLTNGFKFNMI